MKKFLTLALALVMALALAAPAMAFATSETGDLEIGGYEWDFYLVDYSTDDYFSDEDVFITALPEADRGYVTNEVVAAIVECVVPAESYPAGDLDIIVEGEKVAFSNGLSRINSTLRNKAEANNDNAQDYALVWDTSDKQWELATSGAKYDPFVNDGSKAQTLQWLVQGRVTGDDASLTLTVKLKNEGGATMKLYGTEGKSASDYDDEIAVKVGDYTYNVSAYGAKAIDTLNASTGAVDSTTITGDAFSAITTVNGNTTTVGTTWGPATAATVTASVPRVAGGIYKISSTGMNGTIMYIVYDQNYACRAMLLASGTDVWVVGKDYTLYKLDDTATSADGVIAAAIVADGTSTDDTLKGIIKALFATTGADFTSGTNIVDSDLYDYLVAAGTKDTTVLEKIAAAKRYCSVFELDPANLGGRARPNHFNVAGSNKGQESWTIEIAPWEAYVSIPDVDVIDPPQTGDAATIAGFVMIVLAAAGVVVFKKVRA